MGGKFGINFGANFGANFGVSFGEARLAQQQALPRPQSLPPKYLSGGEGRGEGGSKGTRFTDDQIRWLEMIKDHIAANLAIEMNDFDLAPFVQQGGLGRVHQIFWAQLRTIIEELNGVLAA